MKRRNGFTFIEVMVSLFLVTVFVTCVGAVLQVVFRSSRLQSESLRVLMTVDQLSETFNKDCGNALSAVVGDNGRSLRLESGPSLDTQYQVRANEMTRTVSRDGQATARDIFRFAPNHVPSFEADEKLVTIRFVKVDKESPPDRPPGKLWEIQRRLGKGIRIVHGSQKP